LDPNYVDAHFNLGLIYVNQGRFTDAVYELRAAVALGDPQAAAVLKEIGAP